MGAFATLAFHLNFSVSPLLRKKKVKGEESFFKRWLNWIALQLNVNTNNIFYALWWHNIELYACVCNKTFYDKVWMRFEGFTEWK